jgi:adenine-specific DNA-methyltransferase
LEGFPLDSVLQKTMVGKNEVYRVQTDELEHQLLVCMDEKIDDQTISMLQLNSHITFICLDSAISNVNKLRLSDKGLIKTI